jgi:hypothetical protein
MRRLLQSAAMQPNWSNFWSDLSAQLIALLVGGFVFTVGWGVVTGRRDLLSRQVERVSKMMDDSNGALLSYYQALSVTVKHWKMNDGDSETIEEMNRASARSLDKLAGRTFGEIVKLGALLEAIIVFDVPAVQAAADRYVGTIQNAQILLISVRPWEAETEQKLEVAKVALRDAVNHGEILRRVMLEHANFMGIVRYYDRLLHQRPEGE